jgi:type II secretory pathway pseudopilin PulG
MYINRSVFSKRFNSGFLDPQNDAFTLTELAVVIGTIAMLAMVVLPALAGAANKGGRAQCANNLRQIGVASMIYATEYKDWLPIDRTHSASINVLNGIWYTRYMAGGPPNSFIPTNASAQTFNNLGLAYHAALAGNGSIFYCPDAWSTALGANVYSPLLTTDGGGTVRASYCFNPRTVDPTNGNLLRLYQKTSDLPPLKLFAMDDVEPLAQVFNHYRERGWNVLFTDGSVQFSQNIQAYTLIQTYINDESQLSHIQGDQIMNNLELDH